MVSHRKEHFPVNAVKLEYAIIAATGLCWDSSFVIRLFAAKLDSSAAYSAVIRLSEADNLGPLHDGFRGDSVRIFVDGQLAYAGRPRTNDVLGFARVVFGFASGAKSAAVRVRVPSQGIDAEEMVDLNGT